MKSRALSSFDGGGKQKDVTVAPCSSTTFFAVDVAEANKDDGVSA